MMKQIDLALDTIDKNDKTEHYIYVYLDPRKPGKFQYGKCKFEYEPFYIGLGSGKRIYASLYEAYSNTERNSYKCRKIRKIKETGNEPIVLKIKENITLAQSKKLEIYLINKIGRMDLKSGHLTNLKEGVDD